MQSECRRTFERVGGGTRRHFFRPDFGGEKSFHARQKKLEEGITRVLLHRLFSFVVSDSNCATIARNSFCILFFGKKSVVLLSMGIKKISGEKKVLMISFTHISYVVENSEQRYSYFI